MTKRIQIGGSDFGELIRQDFLFVDKSLFIKEIMNDKTKVTIITRPRRWGKTLNLSMLYYFLSADVYGQKTAGLFDHLLIAKEPGEYVKTHQGQYQVIFVTLKDVKAKSFEEAFAMMTELILVLFSQYEYLLDSPHLSSRAKQAYQKILSGSANTSQLERSLLLLSECLYQHHGKKKTYILVDEYDTPLNSAYGRDYFESVAGFMKNFLSASFKDNPYLEKGIMTGILRISKDSMLSGLNNPQIYTMLNDDRYASYFGFIDQELDVLFAEQGFTKNELEIKTWYNGYTLNGITLYNPWSIMCCLDHNIKLASYWLSTGDDSLLKKLLQESDAEVKTQFRLLVQGIPAKVWVNPTMRFDEVGRDKTMLWNLLVSAGYLKVLSSKLVLQGFYECELAIPNHEVMGLYYGTFLEWLVSIEKSPELTVSLSLLAEGRVKEFEKSIERFLKMAASVHDYAHQPEAFYHGFMLALCVALTEHYYIFSNRETGFGRADLMIVPKDATRSQAVILEFKSVGVGETLLSQAEAGLKQIDEKEYASIIDQHRYIKTILKVGMAFDGKAVCCVVSQGSRS